MKILAMIGVAGELAKQCGGLYNQCGLRLGACRNRSDEGRMKDVGGTLRAQSFARSSLVYASYWYMVGPALGVALQFYLNHQFGLVELLGSATYPDVICVFSCVVLVGYIAVASFFVMRKRRNEIAALSTICGVLAMVGIELPSMLGAPFGPWAIVSCFLFSVFLMSHLLLWFQVFVCHDSMLNLIYILISSALAGCLCWFLIGLDGPRLLIALVAVVMLAGAVLVKSFRSTPELNVLHCDKRRHIRSLAGLFAVTFFFGFGYMYTTCFMSLEDFHNVFSWGSVLYSLGLCAAVLVFSRQIRLPVLFYTAALLTIVGILLALFHNPFPLPPDILSNAGFFTYLVFVLVLYCSVSREQNSEPLRASCLLVLCMYLGMLAGRQLFSAVNAFVAVDSASFVHALLALFIAVVLVACAMAGMHIVGRIVSSELSRPGLAHITALESSEVSARIASLYKLSAREAEVLCLLLQGKSATEIAETMIVAHGTAKTHISNIYKKLDIHTREELFAMMPGRPR